jgi:hypothetical protein
LHRYIHHESSSMNRGYVFSHEHDFVRSFEHVETERVKKLLVCGMCDVSYCEWCGKVVSVPHTKIFSYLDARHTLSKIGEFDLR